MQKENHDLRNKDNKNKQSYLNYCLQINITSNRNKNKMSESAGETSKNALMVIGSEHTKIPVGSSNTISDNKPRIVCNELIVSPNKSKSLEKLDELSSLELEIAKMHHVDDVNMETLLSSTSSRAETSSPHVQIISGACENDLSNGKFADISVRSQDVNLKLDALASGDTALEHEDLIAVLKGLESTTDDLHTNQTSEVSILEEGVTIEGEGEYQIMEVVDEDSNAVTDDATKHNENNIVAQTLNKTKTFGSTALTAQEERALALEQMECLKNKHQRRRKQEINPIKQTDIALDLVSSLEADWSENEEETIIEKIKNETKTNIISKYTKPSSSQSNSDCKPNSSLITNVVIIPSTVASSSSVAGVAPSMNINIKADKDKVGCIEERKSLTNDGIIETKTEEDTQVLQSQSGFRRTRIIKRKIIWDPDAPETTFSYAKLVKPNNSKTKAKSDLVATPTMTKGSTTITPIKKETSTGSVTTTIPRKTPRPTTPKSKKSVVDLNTEKTSKLKSDNTSATKINVKTEDGNVNIKSEDDTTKTEKSLDIKVSVSPPKKRSQTPVSNGPGSGGGHKKKKNSELDRLMGDEGAVNMLNSLEKLEATIGSSEIKPTRPMMRSRAATICEKFPRKETTPPARSSSPAGSNQQMNKLKRTPKSRASASWDYVYKKKKQDFDDSLIIRRRSNSSYSSSTSQNRLSLDGQPSNTNESSTKSSDSKNLPASTSQDNSPKTPPSSSVLNKSSGNSKSSSTTPPAGKSFIFAKPENKKTQKRTKSPAATLPNDMKKSAPVANRRNARSPAIPSEDKDSVKSSTKSPITSNSKDKKEAATTSSHVVSDVVVKKSSKVAQILFSTNKAKLNNTFTIQMLNKLVDILDKLSSDSDCHVVVIGTSDTNFCQGVDISDLTTIAPEKRKHYASNLATSVKNYLKMLATFPKPLIAAVCGNVINLGVMQLALFDIVIASDKCTFETPYVKIGQVPEGYCIWHNMNKIRGSFKSKLFWLCEKVQSTEAALAGLVNKLTCSNKVNDEAFNTAKRIASMHSESYGVMKTTVINSNLDVIENSLDEEFNTIIKQWTSTECLENIKKYIEQGHF